MKENAKKEKLSRFMKFLRAFLYATFLTVIMTVLGTPIWVSIPVGFIIYKLLKACIKSKEIIENLQTEINEYRQSKAVEV